MNYNRKREKLLKKLFRLFNIRDENNSPRPASEVGLTFDEISEYLNISKSERNLVLSELWNSKEISLFNNDNTKGCFITDFGIESCSNKKYKRKNENIILNWFKNFVTIFIPVASLIITIIVLIYEPKDNLDKLDKELQTIKQKLEYIEKVQNKKEHSPNFQIHKSE